MLYSKWTHSEKRVTSYCLAHLSTGSKTPCQDHCSVLSVSPFIGEPDVKLKKLN